MTLFSLHTMMIDHRLHSAHSYLDRQYKYISPINVHNKAILVAKMCTKITVALDKVSFFWE